jgi:type II secretory pathway component PulM
MNALRSWWSTRSPRERAVFSAGAAVLVLGLGAAAWIEGERSRARLQAELPRLRASIAALERDAAEVQRLRALPVAQAGAAAPLATLATNGGGLPGAQIAVLDERRVQVIGADLAFGRLLEWLRNAQSTHGMRVESARLDSLAPGRVRAELLLTRS